MSPDEIAALLEGSGLRSIPVELAEALSAYLALLLKWNARMNLTAIRAAREIVVRHFGESLLCARALPPSVKTLLDFGSGAGFPGAVCALARPELAVCLAESQGRKAAFLHELNRVFGGRFEVHAGRAEALPTERLFDSVTLRAVDHMEQACRAALARVRPGGCLALLTTYSALRNMRPMLRGVRWAEPAAVQGSESRVVALVELGEGYAIFRA